MNLKHLSYFVDISKRESFTKAADDIYVSQSALSKSVKSLEQELNVTLIDRTSKSFNLTEEGKILFSEGEKLLQYIDESQNEIIEKICKSRRRLRIGVPPVASTVYFSHLLYRFMKKYPDIDLKMSEVGANIVQTQVNSGSIDFGIVVMPMLNTENYNVIPAMTADNALIVNKDHPLASREEVSFKELEHEDFLILDGTYMLHDSIIRNCEIAGFYPHITTESSQWDFLAEMVAYNQGISILPVPIMKRFSSSEKIKMIRLKEPELPWNIGMIFKKDKLITEQMKVFIQFVLDNKDNVKDYT